MAKSFFSRIEKIASHLRLAPMDNLDIAQDVVSAFVENGVITEEDGEEILRQLRGAGVVEEEKHG